MYEPIILVLCQFYVSGSSHPSFHTVLLNYLAITSTYRPLFRAFFWPAFLGPGAPSKSSILLALLILVAGLLGGPVDGGADVVLLLDTDRERPVGGAPIAEAPDRFSID